MNIIVSKDKLMSCWNQDWRRADPPILPHINLISQDLRLTTVVGQWLVCSELDYQPLPHASILLLEACIFHGVHIGLSQRYHLIRKERPTEAWPGLARRSFSRESNSRKSERILYQQRRTSIKANQKCFKPNRQIAKRRDRWETHLSEQFCPTSTACQGCTDLDASQVLYRSGR